MVEANPVKFYLAKYFFLVLGLVQFATGAILFYLDEINLINLSIISLFIVLGIVAVIFYSIVSEKIKRVAIGNNKFVILQEDINIRFGYPDIKSWRIVPFINLCKVRIKGKKGSIYFFLAGNIKALLESLPSVRTEPSDNA